MSGKNSFNYRVLRWLIILAVLSGVVIIALFCAVEWNQIRERAARALTDFAASPWGEYDEVSPEIFFVSTEDIGDDTLSDLERGLLAYYEKKQTAFPPEKVCHFSDGRNEAYFFVRAAGKTGAPTSGTLLVYTDMSFVTDVVRSAAIIMAFVFIGVAGLLYGAGRYTIRILDRKDQSMQDFFANASHELKTPLIAIRGYAEGLENNIVSHEKVCAVMVKETERMSGLVNSILELSKLDGGVVQLHIAENDVREILYDAIQSVEAVAERRGISIDFDLPGPLLFRCDEELMFSALSNVLTNSVRYAKSRITISAQFEKNREHLKISMSNDGQPVSEQDAAHLFERFYQGNRGQTGLGMALSREYMRLHQGDILVSVRDGKTVFEFAW
ncbi:MAG TPA: hypothetical protein DF613_15745 [Lachnospiraceae bacterium]|nr:hypothetical protein [Lachnospiraceae bacterium]